MKYTCYSSISLTIETSKPKDRKPNVELIDKLGIESISEVKCRGRLRWFGHVERWWSVV